MQQYLKVIIMSGIYHVSTYIPGSPLKQSSGPLKNKAELITLAIGDNNILKFRHDTVCTPGHQTQSSVIIGLCKLVLVCKPEKKVTAEGFLMTRPLFYSTDRPADF